MVIVKVRDKAQITLPAKLRKEVGIKEGDYVRATVERGRIVIAPQVVLDDLPTVTLSKKGEEMVREALDDLEHGRVKAFDNVEDLIEDLRDATAED